MKEPKEAMFDAFSLRGTNVKTNATRWMLVHGAHINFDFLSCLATLPADFARLCNRDRSILAIGLEALSNAKVTLRSFIQDEFRI
jgi:cytosine/uracil/thiamine/allantoin permease